MYNILIVGHGNFASGIKSAFNLLLGESTRVYAQDLSEDITHDEFEKIIEEYLNKYDQLIVFADLMGGAPSQITTRKIVELSKSNEQYIVSGVSLSLMVDIATNILLLNDEDNILEKIQSALDNARTTMGVMSLSDFQEKYEVDENDDFL